MIVDTSALAAILFSEVDATRYLNVIEHAESPAMSSVTYLEIGVVLSRRLVPDRLDDLQNFIENAGIEVVSFTVAHANRAIRAYQTYGRGFHPAGLNFGDCAAYALAVERRQPLLFKGSDFAQTDVRAALA